MNCNGQFENVSENSVIAFTEGSLLRIFFGFKECEKPQDEEGNEAEDAPTMYDCINVDTEAPHTYGSIVAAIVNDKYSADDVQALFANRADALDPDSGLTDEKREEYLAEYAGFQSWRAKAKEVANEVLEIINK